MGGKEEGVLLGCACVCACVHVCVCVKSSLLSSVQQVPIISAAPLLIQDIKDEGGWGRGGITKQFFTHCSSNYVQKRQFIFGTDGESRWCDSHVKLKTKSGGEAEVLKVAAMATM